MFNPHLLSPASLDWAMDQAAAELTGYLAEGNPYEDHGKEWPGIARSNAQFCRAIAAAAMSGPAQRLWVDLAERHENSILPGLRLKTAIPDQRI